MMVYKFLFLPLTISAIVLAFDAKDFLKTDSTLIRNKNGEAILLQGTNLGGWLVTESWMTPVGNDITDYFQLRDVLSGRFGQSKMEKLIDTYQRVWIQSEDLDNIQALVRISPKFKLVFQF